MDDYHTETVKVGDGYRIKMRKNGLSRFDYPATIVGVRETGEWGKLGPEYGFRRKDRRLTKGMQKRVDSKFPVTRYVVRFKHAFDLYSHSLPKSPMSFPSLEAAEAYWADHS